MNDRNTVAVHDEQRRPGRQERRRQPEQRARPSTHATTAAITV